MGLLSRSDTTKEEEAQGDLREAVRSLSIEVAKLSGKREAIGEELDLSDEVVRLKTELSDLEINKSKVEEERAREKREVEHKTGLLKKQVELEKQQAVHEATMAVKEEALKAKEDRFKDEVEFITNRLKGEVEAMRGMYDKVLDRLPNWNIDRKIVEHHGELPVGATAEEE